jgi:hypothetical protein
VSLQVDCGISREDVRERFREMPDGAPIAMCTSMTLQAHRVRTNDRRDFVRRNPPELHALACFVHGALTALHVLGAIYNCRRRNWKDVAIHVGAALYDARSVRHHYRTEQVALRHTAGLTTCTDLETGIEAERFAEPRFETRRSAAGR